MSDQHSRLPLVRLMLLWIGLQLVPNSVLAEQHTTVQTLPPERLVWRKVPLQIQLRVGEERLIHFPQSISIGVPQSLSSRLRSQSINGTLYLLARAPFENTRVMVRSEEGGPLYILDIAAIPDHPEAPEQPAIHVVPEDSSRLGDHKTQATDQVVFPSQWGYVALTRFAAQQLYAPARLISDRAGIVPVPVDQHPVNLVHGGQVEAVPISAWRTGRYFVTAVKLINQSPKAVVLDPRELRGRWLAATFQHNRLLPAGDEADTTTLYLISRRPFAVSL